MELREGKREASRGEDAAQTFLNVYMYRFKYREGEREGRDRPGEEGRGGLGFHNLSLVAANPKNVFLCSRIIMPPFADRTGVKSKPKRRVSTQRNH